MQEHIVDIILAAVIVLMTVRYYRQGLVQTIFKFGSFIVALLAARIFCGAVTDWIYSNTSLFSSTERYLAKLIVFVLIYIAVRLLFTWIIHLLDSLKKLQILKKVYDCLEPGGYLFLGKTETINRQAVPFKLVSPAIFRK